MKIYLQNEKYFINVRACKNIFYIQCDFIKVNFTKKNLKLKNKLSYFKI